MKTKEQLLKELQETTIEECNPTLSKLCGVCIKFINGSCDGTAICRMKVKFFNKAIKIAKKRIESGNYKHD